MRGKAIHINGIVQGVGFRPFVYNLALRHGLAGWVRNTSEGVDIRVDGSVNQLEQFIQALNAEAPPLAHIDALIVRDCSPEAFTKFEIRHSEKVQGAAQPVSPDIAICEDCVRELRTPDDPRYRYPFINCTNCGPRFTLIQDIPYDRPMTTMADFAMCTACAGEYADPLDRRFHAQPIACASCGPHVWLETAGNRLDGDPAIAGTITLLKQGSIVAIKGLGGFHIACDATNPSAVATLRQRKHRADKPFALMMGDIDQIKAYCHVSSAEAALLQSPAAPIVLLDRRNQGAMQPAIAATVAPNQRTFGVMLPYTPLHLLLFDGTMPPLIMTSGNLVDEPIVTKNMAAREQLATLADAFLMHNRDIHIRTDDSVMRLWRGVDLPLRRSRGYVPFPIRLPVKLPPILAVGGEMKNTFCITRGGYAF
ncbi:MAG: carbamoyltransferase HypF, partial [Chloroflexota bacterium]